MSSNLPRRSYSAAGTPAVVNFILGIWILISPFVLGYSGNISAMWNNVIVGIVIVMISAFRIWARSSPSLSWINFAAGIWLIISPWAVRFIAGPGFAWHQVVLGIVVAIVAAVSAMGTSRSYTEPPAGF
jgi:hypothetical protein